MSVRMDPEQHETRALFGMADFSGKEVLEIGSGDGRLTWRFADRASRVTAIEPFEPAIQKARQDLPDALRGRVEFHHIAFEDFAAVCEPATYDIAILSWSLC